MSEMTTTPLNAAQYALSIHLTARHATSLQVDVGCLECLALCRAVSAAEAAVSPAARVVPAPAAPHRR